MSGQCVGERISLEVVLRFCVLGVLRVGQNCLVLLRVREADSAILIYISYISIFNNFECIYPLRLEMALILVF